MKKVLSILAILVVLGIIFQNNSNSVKKSSEDKNVTSSQTNYQETNEELNEKTSSDLLILKDIDSNKIIEFFEKDETFKCEKYEKSETIAFENEDYIYSICKDSSINNTINSVLINYLPVNKVFIIQTTYQTDSSTNINNRIDSSMSQVIIKSDCTIEDIVINNVTLVAQSFMGASESYAFTINCRLNSLSADNEISVDNLDIEFTDVVEEYTSLSVAKTEEYMDKHMNDLLELYAGLSNDGLNELQEVLTSIDTSYLVFSK